LLKMDEKTLKTLEYHKILERLAGYCAFNASAEKARALLPTSDLYEARRRQAVTAEAFKLLSLRPDTTIGGARDIREYAEAATRNVVLEPNQLLDIKYTLIASRTLRRIFEKQEQQFPHISEIAYRLPPPLGLVDAITRTLSERGEVLDSASDKLANIRRDLRIQHDRLLSRMQGMLSNPDIAPYLQDNLVTQRDGRYVLPLRADFKGKVKAVIHDSSSSGATLFVEPLGVVELNNKYRELLLDERDEIRRVLAELSQHIGEHAAVLMEMVAAIADLDLAFSGAKYAEDIHAFEPELIPFRTKDDVLHPGVMIQLREARHPLLDPETVVPVDVELDPQTYALIITGPNTGGKTVTLKTVGLLALMAQSGLHIPAQSGSQISLFTNIYADIGDEQSIEQSLSTFSGHITNIIHILENADRQSLVILDELGAGTDPQEGAALARALLTHLLERGITTLVTTHHPELKAYAHAKPGVVNASVEFDLESLQPTYHLTIGLPGRSNALAIAERLGLPAQIVSEARSEISPSDLRAEDMLDEIHRQRELARVARNAAEESRQVSETIRNELATRLDNVEDERRSLLEESRQEAEEEVKSVREELKMLRRELRKHRQPIQALKEIEDQVQELEEQVDTPVERQMPDVATVQGPVRLGSKVKLRTLGNEGVVTALSEDEAEVQIGVLRIRARLSELVLKGGEPVADRRTQASDDAGALATRRHESPGLELDLRGQRAEDALDILDGYLERAYLAKLPWVRIIHGKGTGKLRKVVREALTQHPHVSSFEGGKRTEGGDGVTVAKLRG
jgi:DNA mismatch repair protein MutS2